MILLPTFIGNTHDAEKQAANEPLPRYAFLAIGDGVPHSESECSQATELVHEVARLPIIAFDDMFSGANAVKFHSYIPADIEAHVTEIALLSEDGVMYGYAPYDPANNGLYKSQNMLWSIFAIWSRPGIAPIPAQRVTGIDVNRRIIQTSVNQDVINSLNLHFFNFVLGVEQGLVDVNRFLHLQQDQLNGLKLQVNPMIAALESQGLTTNSGLGDAVKAILDEAAARMKEKSSTAGSTANAAGADNFWLTGSTGTGGTGGTGGTQLPSWNPTGGEVVLLISQAGAVGSSTFVDTAKNKVITPTNATWSNNQPLFGKPTILCSTGFLRIDDVADFNFIAGQPFCIEFCFFPIGSSNYASLFGREAAPNGVAQNLMNLSHDWAYGTTLYSQGILSGLSPIGLPYVLNSRWSHIAITRDSGGIIRFFANGLLIKSTANLTGISSNVPLFFGAAGGYNNTAYSYFYGSFAEIRIVKGVPVYIENFTPPSAGFV